MLFKRTYKCYSKCKIYEELGNETDNKYNKCKEGLILDIYNKNNCVRDVINIGEEMKIK